MYTVIVQVVKHDYSCIFPFLSSTVHVYYPNSLYKEKFKASYLPEIISATLYTLMSCMLLTVHSLKISIKHVLENLQSFQQLENILIVLFLQLFLG